MGVASHLCLLVWNVASSSTSALFGPGVADVLTAAPLQPQGLLSRFSEVLICAAADIWSQPWHTHLCQVNCASDAIPEYNASSWQRLYVAKCMPLMQGFASGDLERDATAVRMFTDAGVELLLSQVCGL